MDASHRARAWSPSPLSRGGIAFASIRCLTVARQGPHHAQSVFPSGPSSNRRCGSVSIAGIPSITCRWRSTNSSARSAGGSGARSMPACIRRLSVRRHGATRCGACFRRLQSSGRRFRRGLAHGVSRTRDRLEMVEKRGVPAKAGTQSGFPLSREWAAGGKLTATRHRRSRKPYRRS